MKWIPCCKGAVRICGEWLASRRLSFLVPSYAVSEKRLAMITSRRENPKARIKWVRSVVLVLCRFVLSEVLCQSARTHIRKERGDRKAKDTKTRHKGKPTSLETAATTLQAPSAYTSGSSSGCRSVTSAAHHKKHSSLGATSFHLAGGMNDDHDGNRSSAADLEEGESSSAPGPHRTLRTLALVTVTFFCTAGGPYGLETILRESPARAP